MRRSRHFRIILVVLIVLAVGLIVFLRWDTGARAERRVREFLVAENPSGMNRFNDSIWSSARIGRSSWIVHLGFWGLPMKPDRFLVDREGTVYRIAAEPLSDILREEFRPRLTDPDHEKFISDLIQSLHDESFIRLQSVDDIPGYKNRPLLAEQAVEVQPPHRTPEGNQVFFTYQQIGGFVRRHEVHHAKDGSFLRVTETVLGEGIGQARYYR